MSKKVVSNDKQNNAKVLTLVKKHFVNNTSEVKTGAKISDKNTAVISNIQHHQYDLMKPVSMVSSGSCSSKPILVLKNISEMTSVNLPTKQGK